MSGTVTTEAQLNTAIAALDTTAVAGTYTITLANNITLDAAVDLDALNLHTGVNVVINGNGFTLDGGGVQRGIFVNVGNVTLQNLTIAHAVAQGGAGGLGVRDGGGGGAGLGGGLFVGSSATVTLSSVTFSSDQAKGGAGGNSFGGYNTVSHTPNGDGGYGGGGGMGGAGGFGIGFSPGGGGGLGNHATGGTIPSAYGQTTPGTGILNGGSSAGNGVVYPGGGTNTAQKGGKYGGGGGYGIGHRGTNPYAGSGAGGGGVAGSIGSLTGSGTGGNGGFGGGGGGGYGHGGAGGFGGGGGGGYYSSGIGGFGGGGGGGGSIAATGGFGGGSGATAGLKSGGAGGGGMGAGGDIFVANGGSLIMQAGTLSGGSVIGGAGGAGSHGAASGSAGSASGSGIFLNGNQSISLAPTAGQTLTVSDVIADQTGSGGTGTNAAAGVLLIGGGGLVALGAANTFTGGSTIQSGATLDLTASSAGGTGAITFASGSTGLLQIQNAALTSNQLTNTVSLLAAGDAIDLAGLTFAAGKSTATFSSGTLSVTNGTTTDKITLGGVSAGTTFVAVQDHATGIAALTPNFSVGSLSQLTTDLTSINSGGVASFGNVPYAFTLTAGIALGSVQTLNLLSASSLTLSGTAATGGGWNINAGTLVAGAAGLIGNGSVTVASGATLGLNNFAQTITDLSGAGAVTLGTGTLTEGTSTSTSFSGVISGTGGLVKQGTGTLTLSGVNSFTGPTTINAGEVLLSTGGSLSGNIVDGSTLAINETGNVTLAGTISGAGLLLQSGSGTTALTGTNTFSGAATITAGALQLGNGGTVGSLGSTSGVGGSGGALVFNRSDVVGFAPVIGGSVAVTQSGSGTTQLTGTDTYTGATTINAGTLEIGNGSTTGSIANTASIAGSGGVLAFDRSNSLTFAAKISGSVGLVQAGTGLTALTAANSFTGGTTIQAGTLQIGNGGAVGSLSGAITDNSTLAVNETGAVSLSGTISGSGKLVQAGSGTTTLGAANTFSGGIALNAGVLVLGHTGAAGSGAINFAAGTAQTLDFTIANAPTNTITGFEIGDTLDLTNAADVTATNLLAGNVLQIVRSGGGTIDLQLDAGVAGKFFFHTGDGVTGTAITESNVACYLIGTLILTDRGEVPVQDLAIGDSVVTLDGSAKPIKWIGRRSYASAFAAGNRDVVPIWIGAGALADGVPKRDLIVSPLHALYLDGRLVPAGALVNGVSIIQRLDIDPIRYFHIELARHDVIYAEGAPAETFVDCDSRGMFHNAEEFDALYPGDNSPCWAFCAPRVDSGPALVAIRRVIDRRAGIDVRDDTAPGPLQGFLDGMDGARLTGWAFDADHPNQPVVLEVLDGEGVIAQVTADRYRQDLEEAGIGDGRHAFDLMLGAGLAALPRQLHVRRAADGRELNGSPLLLRPAAGPDVLRQAIAAAAQGADAGTLGELVDVLLQGLDQVRHQHAASPRDDAKVAPLLAWRGGPRSAAPRALVIDDQLPQAGRDAGSNAIHSHIAALQALGWEVDCVAAHQGAADDKAAAALEASGVRCHRAPLVASVEEVLRRQRDAFDLVYLHRLSNAEAYAGLARAWQKRAHLIFSVADLHHLRLARQARAQSCIEVMSEARATREREFAAMRMVDAVITHSTAEAAYLADEAPGARVHVVPWAIAPQARVVSWAARDGIAFIGGYRHGPNPDAACFLAETVMPLVWQALPDVPLMIVGDEWPAALPWARDKRIRMVGRIRRLSDLFDLVRLTVAPLRFGAGLKGKVLDSFAAGIPCVMSPVAAEGMPLCATLQGLVGEDAAAIAAHIVRLHSDAGAAIACREAGLSMVESVFSAEAVAQALVPALGPKRARSARRKADAGSSPKIRGARKAAGKRHSAPGH